jgi:hypothetical protein
VFSKEVKVTPLAGAKDARFLTLADVALKLVISG